MPVPMPPWPVTVTNLSHLLGAGRAPAQKKTRTKVVQCQVTDNSVSTSIKLLSTSTKLAVSSKCQKSESPWPFQVTFQEKWLLAVSGTDLGLELTTSSLRQPWNSSLACFSAISCKLLQVCKLAWINPQALFLTVTVSGFWWKSQLTCVWTSQDFLNLIVALTGTGSNLLRFFAGIACIQKSWGQGMASAFSNRGSS